MKTLQVGAIVQALLAIANADNPYWRGLFTLSAGLGLYLAYRLEQKSEDAGSAVDY